MLFRSKYNHPLLNGLVVGFNMAEPALKIFGRDYCSWEGIAELNIHNRFFPEVTLGVGSGKKNAEDTELSVHCKPAFFTKVGMNYNFNFNGDNPNYFYVGIKYGFTSYKTNYSGMTYDDGYWETTGPYNYSNQKFNSHWLEFAFGIRVKIIENFYMG